MKSVLDFLGVDVDALKKEKRKILINGVGITQYFMLLRFATRKVDVSGFYIDDFESDKPYYLANKRIYGKCDIENDGNEYLLVKCERNHPTPGGGYCTILKLRALPRRKMTNVSFTARDFKEWRLVSCLKIAA